MDEHKAICAEVRARLREYVLEQCPDFDAHIAACPGCREAVEAERALVSRLDELPPVEPPAGLAESTLEHVMRAGAAREAAARKRFVRLPLAAAAACAVVLAAAVLLSLPHVRESHTRRLSVHNMRILGVALKMYANESRGEMFPPMAAYSEISVIDLRAIYPKYLADTSALVNPALPDARALRKDLRHALEKEPPDWDRAHRIVAQSYVYLGYNLRDETDLETFQVARLDAADGDIRADGQVLYRLREGVERFLITDINNPSASAIAQSEIPVLLENPSARKGGINVLYMDGHVDFVRHGEKFPATDAVKQSFPLIPLEK